MNTGDDEHQGNLPSAGNLSGEHAKGRGLFNAQAETEKHEARRKIEAKQGFIA